MKNDLKTFSVKQIEKGRPQKKVLCPKRGGNIDQQTYSESAQV